MQDVIRGYACSAFGLKSEFGHCPMYFGFVWSVEEWRGLGALLLRAAISCKGVKAMPDVFDDFM